MTNVSSSQESSNRKWEKVVKVWHFLLVLSAAKRPRFSTRRETWKISANVSKQNQLTFSCVLSACEQLQLFWLGVAGRHVRPSSGRIARSRAMCGHALPPICLHSKQQFSLCSPGGKILFKPVCYEAVNKAPKLKNWFLKWTKKSVKIKLTTSQWLQLTAEKKVNKNLSLFWFT